MGGLGWLQFFCVRVHVGCVAFVLVCGCVCVLWCCGVVALLCFVVLWCCVAFIYRQCQPCLLRRLQRRGPPACSPVALSWVEFGLLCSAVPHPPSSSRRLVSACASQICMFSQACCIGQRWCVPAPL